MLIRDFRRRLSSGRGRSFQNGDIRGGFFGLKLTVVTPRREPELHIHGMSNYQEQIGRAGIVVGLMPIAVFAAVIAQDRNESPEDDQLVIVDGVTAATGQ
jgi:hypothetical protein